MRSPTSTDQKLIQAYNRLVTGSSASHHTDGKVTFANVAIEAGVSRATAYRSAELRTLFNPKATKSADVAPSSERTEEEAEKRRTTERGLRSIIRKLLSRLVAMQARERHLLQRIKQLESEAKDPASNVVPIGGSHG
jgi:hypothetical protein